MEAFSSTSTNYSSPAAPMYLTPSYSQEFGRSRPQQSFHSSLHLIRSKPNMKVWKKWIAPFPPTPPRVYKVDPMNFKELVQNLTGAASDFSHQPRLQSVAPPPLNIARSSSLSSSSPLSAFYQELMSEILDGKTKKTSETGMGSSSLELSLASPTSWCSFPLLSPGTLTSLEQVL